MNVASLVLGVVLSAATLVAAITLLLALIVLAGVAWDVAGRVDRLAGRPSLSDLFRRRR